MLSVRTLTPSNNLLLLLTSALSLCLLSNSQMLSLLPSNQLISNQPLLFTTVLSFRIYSDVKKENSFHLMITNLCQREDSEDHLCN